MDFDKQFIIGLVVSLQEQTQILMDYINILKTILEDDADDEDFVGDISMTIPRKVWILQRYGTFWEKDVPNNGDAFFKENFRIDRETFSLLVQKLEVLRKKDTNLRHAIPLEKRVSIALYSLGSSAEYRTVGRLFGVSTSIVCKILHEFCKAIIEKLSEEYLPYRTQS